MPEISILQAILNGGPALMLLVALCLVWKTWRNERAEHESEKEALREVLQEVQDARVADAERWAEKLCKLAKETERTIADVIKITDLIQKLGPSRGRGEA